MPADKEISPKFASVYGMAWKKKELTQNVMKWKKKTQLF